MIKRAVFASLIVVLGLSLASCSGEKKPDGMPKLFPCQITLTQGGAPLEGATIICVSDDASLIRWPVTGVTDANGVAKIVTMGKYEGAPQSSFAVTVTKNENEWNEGHSKENDDPADKVYSLVESKYETKQTTPLKIDVAAGKNEFTLDCGEAVRELRTGDEI